MRQILAEKLPFQLYEFLICEAESANEEGEKHFRHGTNQMQWAEIEGEV
jgi:hypothetical protein